MVWVFFSSKFGLSFCFWCFSLRSASWIPWRVSSTRSISRREIRCGPSFVLMNILFVDFSLSFTFRREKFNNTFFFLSGAYERQEELTTRYHASLRRMWPEAWWTITCVASQTSHKCKNVSWSMTGLSMGEMFDQAKSRNETWNCWESPDCCQHNW